MTDTNSTTLRNALAAAVKNHVEANGLSAKDGSHIADVQLSRFYQVMRGEVGKISSDALVNMLGNFGYRLTGIVGSGNGSEIVLSLDANEAVLPDVEKPQNPIEAVRPVIEQYAASSGFEVDHESIDAAAAYCDQGSDPDADRVVSTDE